MENAKFILSKTAAVHLSINVRKKKTLTLNVSTKKIFTVVSNKAAAIYFPLGDIRTQRTLSSNFKVLLCTNDKTLALLSLLSSTISSNCQNFTVVSPLPLIHPL